MSKPNIEEILGKQISEHYCISRTNTNTELIGIKIDPYGRLFVNREFEIHIKFDEELHENNKIIKLFFEGRIKSEYMRIYLSNKEFKMYPKTYGVNKISDLELAMEYYSLFVKTYTSLIDFYKYSKL